MESVRQYKISASESLPWEVAKEYPNGMFLWKIFKVEDIQPEEEVLTSEQVVAWEKENVPQLDIG